MYYLWSFDWWFLRPPFVKYTMSALGRTWFLLWWSLKPLSEILLLPQQTIDLYASTRNLQWPALLLPLSLTRVSWFPFLLFIEVTNGPTVAGEINKTLIYLINTWLRNIWWRRDRLNRTSDSRNDCGDEVLWTALMGWQRKVKGPAAR